MRSFSKVLISFLFAFFLVYSKPVSAYVPVVSDIINDVEDAATSLINQGFDRLDRSMINFGVELERSANLLRQNYAGMLGDTIEKLDPAQKRVIQDLQGLVSAFETAESEQVNDIIDAQRQTVDKVYAAFSNTALVTKISQRQAAEGDKFLRIDLIGAALKLGDITSTIFNGETLDKEIVSQSTNSGLSFKLPITSLQQEDKERGVWFLPFEVQFESCGFWSFIRGCENQTFRYEALIFPKTLGYVSAIFSGQLDVQERRSVTRGPFTTERVKTRLKLSGTKRGSRTDVHTASATSGWTIDVPTSEFSFSRDHGGCSSSRATAAWVRREPMLLQVRAVTASDSHVGSTCRTTTNIIYDEVRTVTKPSEGSVGGEAFPLVLEGEVVLKLDDATNLKQPRLSHIMIVSDLLREDQGHTMIITPNDQSEFGQGAIRARYLAASNSVYVSIK